MTLTKKTQAVKETIEALIQTATNYNIETLESIYHNDMTVTILDISDDLSIADKATFVEVFKNKRDHGAPPMNTWAKFHHIHTQGDKAHVLLSRKNDLGGYPQILTLSIDLVFQEERWQVMREVIFTRPDQT